MNPTKPGWQTSEFWLALAGVAAKVIIVLVILGVIPVDKQQTSTEAIVNLIVAIGSIVGISTATNAYGKRRNDLKKKMIDVEMMAATRSRVVDARSLRVPNQPGVRR